MVLQSGKAMWWAVPLQHGCLPQMPEAFSSILPNTYSVHRFYTKSVCLLPLTGHARPASIHVFSPVLVILTYPSSPFTGHARPGGGQGA